MSMTQQTSAGDRAPASSGARTSVGAFFFRTAEAFRKGDLWTRLSAVFCGAGFFARG